MASKKGAPRRARMGALALVLALGACPAAALAEGGLALEVADEAQEVLVEEVPEHGSASQETTAGGTADHQGALAAQDEGGWEEAAQPVAGADATSRRPERKFVPSYAVEYALTLNNAWHSYTPTSKGVDGGCIYTFRLDKPSLVRLGFRNNNKSFFESTWELWNDDVSVKYWHKYVSSKGNEGSWYGYLSAGNYSMRAHVSTNDGFVAEGTWLFKGTATAVNIPTRANDSATDALAIPKDTKMRGLFTAGGARNHYYKFTLNGPATVSYACSEDDDSLNVVNWCGLLNDQYQESSHIYVSGTNSGTIDLDAGTYYLKVVAYQYNEDGGPYTISWSTINRNLASAGVRVSPSSYTFDGEAKRPSVTVTLNGTTLSSGTDYTVTYSKNTNPGTARVVVEGAGKYSGSKTVTFTIKKAANPLAVRASSKAVRYAKVKKKAVTVARPLSVSGARGKVTYQKASGSGRLTVNKKTGKVTVKKGTKRGTYKVRIKVTAAGNGKYKSKSKTVTTWVRVS